MSLSILIVIKSIRRATHLAIKSKRTLCRQVAVYVTDGASGDLETTLREAQTARFDNDVEMYGVGVGPGINPTELRAIPSCPTKTHLHTVPDHQYLYTVAHKLTQQLCYGRSRTLVLTL